ncbi:MAG: DmsC/YnfH family molybdoenzyme membrane anchor subunit [Pseudomonadota bacterium]
MNPAFSVLIFTTLSGAGYGLLTLVALLRMTDAFPAVRWLGFTSLSLALVLITIGLMASTFHLGHPERAWRALSQWRSSWLSREGVMALVTYMPAGLLWLGWIFWQADNHIMSLLALMSALGAILTVICTGMIYASLKTIPQWHNVWTVPVYLMFALMTGALLCYAISLWFGLPAADGLAVLVLLSLLGAWAVKWSYWQAIDTTPKSSDIRSATGLAAFAEVRLLDPPHTEENFLMKEMGYQVGRKHATKLRRLALLLGGVLPFALTLLAIAAASGPFWIAAVIASLAALSGIAGVFIERWLLFAQAQHKVTLYYGQPTA